MCKSQRRTELFFARSLAALVALSALDACSTRSRRGSSGELSGLGDRGGSWPGGIGAVLRFRARDGLLVVHRAPADGAAARQGLREGDVIEAIDGVAVAGRTEREVVTALRGEVGTAVVLRVSGADGGAAREVSVERAPYRRSVGD